MADSTANHDADTANDLSGTSHNAFQARSIDGGIHIHAAGQPANRGDLEPRSELDNLRRELHLTRDRLSTSRAGRKAADRAVKELKIQLATVEAERDSALRALANLRNSRAAVAALANIGQPRFRTTSAIGYDNHSVNALMRALRESVQHGPAAIVALLAFPDLTISTQPNGLLTQDVVEYLATVREAMANLLA